MPYELFVKNALKPDSPATLTIRNGLLYFNAAASEVLAGVGTRFVHLLLDPDKGKLAIRPTQKEDENTFTFSARKEKRGATITARSFLSYIGWAADKPVTVDVQWNSKERIMEAVLPKEHVGPLIRHTPTDTRRRGTKHDII